MSLAYASAMVGAHSFRSNMLQGVNVKGDVAYIQLSILVRKQSPAGIKKEYTRYFSLYIQ